MLEIVEADDEVGEIGNQRVQGLMCHAKDVSLKNRSHQ